VEDSRNGVLAARAAGMACAALPCPATAHEDFTAATVRLATLPDLLAVVGS
jgi:beta-phosphoglucomutase-like phosphatase (HAD superfamily)